MSDRRGHNIDCVLGYHLNPLTCGVAKFNSILALRLGNPVIGLFDPKALDFRQPLISLKVSEFTPEDISRLDELLDRGMRHQGLRVFFHDFSHTDIEHRLARQAAVVYSGNSEVAEAIREVRADLVELWCPPMLTDTQRFGKAKLSVFSFGMAHKIRADYYGKLRQLLDDTGTSYCLYLSTALHENTSFDGSFMSAFQELSGIFGHNVYFMGFLSDTAVYNYLADATFFTAFFERGVRSNNSSVNAAMQTGSVVITNLDQHSPSSFLHLDNVLDINQLDTLPTDHEVLSGISRRAAETASTLDWDPLLAKVLQKEGAL